MFLATSIAMQQEVKIGRDAQSTLIQRLSNLLGTGEDNVSYKKAIEKLNKKQLDEIGTERSREKPINILEKNIEKNKNEINELKKYENILYEIEEEKNKIKNNIEKNKIKNNLLKEIKKIKDKNNIENEKIKIKEKINEENKNKIEEIKNKIRIKEQEYSEKNNDKKYLDKKYEKNKLNNKLNIFLIILILINILWIIFIPKIINNLIIKYIFLLTVPTYLIFCIFLKNKLNKKLRNLEKNKREELEKIENEKNNLLNEKKIIEKNWQEINNEINKIKTENNSKNNLEEYKLLNKYKNELDEEEINNLLDSEKVEEEININEYKLNNDKLEINKLEIKKDNIEPQLENLSKLEEELIAYEEQHENLQKINMSIELTKKLLGNAYERMKNSVSPIFTEKLSKNIAKITKNKYTNLYFSDDQGLTIELDNGNYIPADRLSIGTIDQLYLSLRLAMLDEISNEKVPIILDEAFAYFDNDRLKNILIYLTSEFKDRQIIILTCTKREKEILDREKIKYNEVIL